MSSNIETVLQEKRVFPPAPAFVKQANISGMDAYRKLAAEAERDFEGSGRASRARTCCGRSPLPRSWTNPRRRSSAGSTTAS